jgi:hypothetical protein
VSSQLGFGFEAADHVTLADEVRGAKERPADLNSRADPRSRRERFGAKLGLFRPAQRAERDPPRTAGQLTLTLDHRPHASHEITIRGKIRVEDTLRSALGARVIVELTGNRSTMISYNRRNGVLYVRAHAIFQDANEAVLRAVASFVSGGRTSAKDARLIDDYIEIHRHRIRKPPERELLVQPYGEHHDLRSSLERINREFFANAIRAAITWSKAARNQRRSSIRMGSYCDEQNLIRIHPALDQAFVPKYFVEAVIFHEMLHEHHGIEEMKDGRRCIHSREFLNDERRFPEFDDARRWERKHLHKLLRY